MQITYEFGAEVIQKLRRHLNVPINIMNTEGLIVASTDDSRIGHMHRGAKQVLKEKRDIILSPEDLASYPGTKPGVNLPMYHFQEIVGVIGITGHPDQVLQAANIIRTAVEMAVEQIHLQSQLFFKDSVLNNWLQQVFHPLGVDENRLEQEAHYLLKLRIDEPVTIVVFEIIHARKFAETIKNKLNACLFLSVLNENEIVLGLKNTVTKPDVQHLLQTEASFQIGIGKPGTSVLGMRASYFQAKHALRLNQRKQKDDVSHINDWELERLLDHIDTDVCHEVLALYTSKLQKMEQSYIETLQAYFESHLQTKASAEKLHIHRNTLLYRLDQIKQKVGLDPRNFREAMILFIIHFQLDE